MPRRSAQANAIRKSIGTNARIRRHQERQTAKVDQVVRDVLSDEHGREHQPGTRLDYCPKCQAAVPSTAHERGWRIVR